MPRAVCAKAGAQLNCTLAVNRISSRLRNLSNMSTHILSTVPSMVWFDAPAETWDWRSALPLGNGRLGALVHGSVHGILEDESIILNEDSVWTRLKWNHNNPSALEALPRVRDLLFEGRAREALELAENQMMGVPSRVQPYQPLGTLNFRFKPRGAAHNYRRELNLDSAIVRVEYTQDNIAFRREVFCSAVDQVLVVRLTCEASNSDSDNLDFTANLWRAWDAQAENVTANQQFLRGQAGTQGPPFAPLTRIIYADANCARAWGAQAKNVNANQQCRRGQAGTQGTRFAALMRIIDEDGIGAIEAHGDKLLVRGTRAITILLSARTDYRSENPEAECRHDIESAASHSFDELKMRHLAEHQSWFRRARVELHDATEDESVALLPTDKRLKRVREGASDAALASLYFDFGRYLLIASSRPGTLPANLQGIWNPLMDPPWASDFHTNINIQMNYWPSGVCNLSECQTALFDWMESLVAPGRETARVHYGCEGFVVHHVSDPWGWTVPGDIARTGVWPMGGAWLCDHVWEQWLFDGDETWLRVRGFPLLRENALFLMDFLVEDESGMLVSGPSSSPENTYYLSDGTEGALCMAPSMDTQIIRETLGHCLEAARILKIENELQKRIEAALSRLPEHKIGKHGQLQEWVEDYDEPDPGHRHISHLFALHPGTQISPRRTPELAQAAVTTLERRLEHGGASTGWSAAWIACHRARLNQAEEAHAAFLHLLRHSTGCNLMGGAQRAMRARH